jgi:hypothetical protein
LINYRRRANTLESLPTAIILFLIALLLNVVSSDGDMGITGASSSSDSSSSSLLQQFRIAINISVTRPNTGEYASKTPNEHHTLFSDKRKTPSEHIHEIGKPVRVRSAIELPNVHDIALVLENGSLVVVDVKIVGCTEYGHDGRKARCLGFPVHAVSNISNELIGALSGLVTLTQRPVLRERV